MGQGDGLWTLLDRQGEIGANRCSQIKDVDIATDAIQRRSYAYRDGSVSCDLKLEIAPGTAPGLFTVTVDSPGGAASGIARLDLNGLLGRRRELAASVLASAVTSRIAELSALERPVREVGEALFAGLFAERIYGRYTASLLEAARRSQPLRVVLRLRAPELAGLPWETLFDPEVSEYLCQREPVVRYVETARPATPLLVDPPLRILGLIATPRDLPRLDVDEEKRRLTDAVADLCRRRQVELVWAPGGSWPVLQQQLLAGPWHVVHFVGHGGTDASGGSGVLALEDEATGQAALVSSGRFARLLHACRPSPRLVVLNSCQSGECAADDLLSNTAAALVHSGVSAAVAMQFAVTDVAALAFARGFYQALARGNPVDEAVRIGRIAIDGTGEHTLEWVTPVLYLRTEDTRLFAVRVASGGVTVEPEQPSGERVADEAAMHGLYVQALAALRADDPDEAIALLDSLLILDPNYRDAKRRREVARRAQQLAFGYQRARTAEDAGNWDRAAREYTEILREDPDYRDAAERRNQCHARQRVPTLQDEPRLHIAGGNWAAVPAVGEQAAALHTAAPDLDAHATTAPAQLEAAREIEKPEPTTCPGQQVARLADDDSVMAVAFSPDGTRLATASRDNTARLWEVSSGQEMARLAHDDSVMAVAFNSDLDFAAGFGVGLIP
ncbi:MAG: CHAT domain-containing protein [Mycobacterium leprae]